MIKKLAISILVDSRADNPACEGEHGFSLWIEADEIRLLFDVGQTGLVVRNAEILGIDLRLADALILSHGHYDHTGALDTILAMNPELSVYCHNDIFLPRYSLQADGTMKQIGLSTASQEALQKHSNAVVKITGVHPLTSDCIVTGPIPRQTAFETTGGAFYLDNNGEQPDPITDDLALWFTTRRGIVVVTGCSHSGIVNTLAYVRKYTKSLPVTAVIGGFHLINASEKRLAETCRYLQDTNIGMVVPCHCTGDAAVIFMQSNLHGMVIEHGAVGKVFEWT